MSLSLIVAMSENRVIGRDGDLPWRLSADLRRFKQITMGHHVIMGRLTYESIGRPLPGRISVVVTSQADYQDSSIKVARSLEEALQFAAHDDEPFITGGASVFAAAWPKVRRLYLTRVHAALDGDVLFPDVEWGDWALVAEARHAADAKNQYDYSFLTYIRQPTCTDGFRRFPY